MGWKLEILPSCRKTRRNQDWGIFGEPCGILLETRQIPLEVYFGKNQGEEPMEEGGMYA